MIQAKNKKLAELIGKDVLYGTHVHHPSAGDGLVTLMKYDCSWDWLMEVVHHIENIILPETDNCFNVTIGAGLYCVIQDAYGELIEITGDGATKILSVHEACVKFADWYEMQR